MGKNLAVLGSTGSIGTQTLSVVRQEKDLRVVCLAANENIELLEKQIREFLPELVCVYRKDRAQELKKKVADLPVSVCFGMEGLIACATHQSVELVVAAAVGTIGIRPVIKAIQAKKDIAFANKETLVAAGHLIMPQVKENGVNFLPVDSEHSAVFQCLNGEEKKSVKRLILTASGGPFRGKSKEELKTVTVKEALRHPNWSMGKKVTIDSATMANKALEVMEAKWLFDLPLEKIDVVVHPQSIIHSMVEFKDGAIMAQLAVPDMTLPIHYALNYPERKPRGKNALDLTKCKPLTFEQIDKDAFPLFFLGLEAAKTGGSMPCVFNFANERAVELFLRKAISFSDMAFLVDLAMQSHTVIPSPTLEQIEQIKGEVTERIDKLADNR